jgi:response regulator RpfG family c-di-GMP phosphodiesterase
VAASKAEQVLDALKALLETVPDAVVQRMRTPKQSGQQFRSKMGSESNLRWAAIPTKVGTGPG